MSAESGWGSSLWGYGKYGVESNVDATATINIVSTVTASATESMGASAEIDFELTVTCAAGQVYFGAAAIDIASSFTASARFLWEPQTTATTTWTKQVA
tara:strand:- start:4964 stop:5260 length:297 start_codon:yes stop_codon:yes gene_type:complete